MFERMPKWLGDVLRALVVALLGALADGSILGGAVSGAAHQVVHGPSVRVPVVAAVPAAKP